MDQDFSRPRVAAGRVTGSRFSKSTVTALEAAELLVNNPRDFLWQWSPRPQAAGQCSAVLCMTSAAIALQSRGSLRRQTRPPSCQRSPAYAGWQSAAPPQVRLSDMPRRDHEDRKPSACGTRLPPASPRPPPGSGRGRHSGVHRVPEGGLAADLVQQPRAPRGATAPWGGETPSPLGCRSSLKKLGAA
jgi:hypothetical protein